jgi:hypothetical protein
MDSESDNHGESAAAPWTADQVMFTLAYLAYDGESSTDPHFVMKQLLHDLATVAPLQQQWELVWGPALYKLPIGLLDDNMWYVVRNVATGEYAIGIRGTNADAILDWIVEDFWITSQVRWPYGGTPGLVPKIADGTSFAIDKLLNIMPSPGIRGAGMTLPEYLATQTRTRAITVTVTGHSLGGCLSSTLALALKDTTTRWSPPFTPTVRSWSFAGPTAGNVDFARYTDLRLGNSLHRWVNTLDVAPLAWNESALNLAWTIYSNHGISPNLFERGALDLAKFFASGLGYTQPSVGTVTRNGIFKPGSPYHGYAAQADWQHTDGYIEILGLGNVLPRKVSAPTPERMAARLEALRQRPPRTPGYAGAAATPASEAPRPA